VFICTYNRGSLINGTLKSLIDEQSISPDEIVIVNGGGMNNCQPTLKKWQKRFPKIKIIQTKNKNLAASRNIGLPHCIGDLILQTDDDARPFPDWIEKMIHYHKKFPNAGVIGGPVFDNRKRSFLNKTADVTTFPYFNTVQSVRSVPGVNSSYKQEVVKQIQSYDESLFRGEDVDFNWRTLLNGWEIFYIPEIKVHHIHRSSWMGLFEQHFMYGRAHYLVRKKWPEMYSHYPIKISSIKQFIKWIISWTWIPFYDATQKAKRMNQALNGFDVLVLFLVNLSNRLGSAVQRKMTLSQLI
jgi:glycosyltransferase involved in cell wall biosynthesis